MKGIYREAELDNRISPVFSMQDVSLPELGPNEVRLEVKACGLSLLQNKVLNELFRKDPQARYPVGQEVAGVVAEVGCTVSSLQTGDRVAGLIPLNFPCPGCAEVCQINEYDVVKLPDRVSFVDAAAVVGEGARAYQALHYGAHVCGGDSVLITRAASAFGTVSVQLALLWGAKVICVVNSQNERVYLEENYPGVARVLEATSGSSAVVTTLLEETGGLGVDVVVDTGVRLFSSEQDKDHQDGGEPDDRLSKHDILSCLSVGGRWVTSQSDLQLDPPDCQLLFLKSASVSFVFEHTWTLAKSQHGRYQHVLHDLMEKVAAGSLKANITRTANLENALEVLQSLDERSIGKAVMVQ